MIDLVNIAHIGSTQGKLGALKIFPIDLYENVLLKSEYVFFRIDGSKVPFKIKKINSNHEPWLLYLEGMGRPEDASTLSNSELYVESMYIDEALPVKKDGMEGYEVLSSEDKVFGVILAVEEHPQQILLLVKGEKGNFRIPFHPDLIQELDTPGKKVIYNYNDLDLGMLA